MKRLLVVSFIIGLLSASIHALSTEPEGNAALPEQYYAASPEQYYAASPAQYYAAPPTQYYAPTNCVPFTQNSDPEAGVRSLLAHPGTRVCPGLRPDLEAQRGAVEQGAVDIAIANARLRCSMSGRVC